MDERLKKILQLVKDGKITPQDADRLISELYENQTEGEKRGCYLKINLIKENDEKVLNIKLPVKFIKFIAKATGKFSFNIMDGEGKIFNNIFNKNGSIMDDDGRIIDFQAFSDSLDELCKNAPCEVINLSGSNKNGEKFKLTVTLE